MKSEVPILDVIAQTIFDKKGFNILVLDVRGISTMTDYFVIAEGTVDRHVRSICFEISAKLREMGYKPLHTEGEKDGDWVVIDFGEVVIHLFIPDVREKYALEEVWKSGKIVDVEIAVHKDEEKVARAK